jgi:hypothetical protein
MISAIKSLFKNVREAPENLKVSYEIFQAKRELKKAANTYPVHVPEKEHLTIDPKQGPEAKPPLVLDKSGAMPYLGKSAGEALVFGGAGALLGGVKGAYSYDPEQERDPYYQGLSVVGRAKGAMEGALTGSVAGAGISSIGNALGYLQIGRLQNPKTMGENFIEGFQVGNFKLSKKKDQVVERAAQWGSVPPKGKDKNSFGRKPGQSQEKSLFDVIKPLLDKNSAQSQGRDPFEEIAKDYRRVSNFLRNKLTPLRMSRKQRNKDLREYYKVLPDPKNEIEYANLVLGEAPGFFSYALGAVTGSVWNAFKPVGGTVWESYSKSVLKPKAEADELQRKAFLEGPDKIKEAIDNISTNDSIWSAWEDGRLPNRFASVTETETQMEYRYDVHGYASSVMSSIPARPSVFGPAAVVGLGFTGMAATGVAGSFSGTASSGPETHPYNVVFDIKNSRLTAQAQMQADASQRIKMSNPNMLGIQDIEEAYFTNPNLRPTRGRHTPGKYNDDGNLVFALSALRKG